MSNPSEKHQSATQNVTDNLVSKSIEKENPIRRGAPELPDEVKRTARYPLRIWQSEHRDYDQYCRTHGFKLAEFYRDALREYLAEGDHAQTPESSTSGWDKLYILHMTVSEKNNYQVFAKMHKVSLNKMIRTAVNKFYNKRIHKDD